MQNAVRADLFIQSLALSVARNQVGANVPIDQVIKSEGITLAEYQEIEANPTFQAYLNRYVTELKDSGFSFEAKCRVLAEDLLPNFYHMARDPDTPAPVRAKVVENLVKWANLEPKSDVKVGGGAGFSINIVLPGENSGETTTITAKVEPKTDAEDTDAINAEFTEIPDDSTDEPALDALPEPQKEPKGVLSELFDDFFSDNVVYAGDVPESTL